MMTYIFIGIAIFAAIILVVLMIPSSNKRRIRNKDIVLSLKPEMVNGLHLVIRLITFGFTLELKAAKPSRLANLCFEST
ncbi:hypothetical protein NXV08_00225 (plasmid) [Bacteroides fragilis]|nr:hypothetical protein [Bacteroides fragilis]